MTFTPPMPWTGDEPTDRTYLEEIRAICGEHTLIFATDPSPCFVLDNMYVFRVERGEAGAPMIERLIEWLREKNLQP